MRFETDHVYGIEGGQLTKLACLSDILKCSGDADTAQCLDEVLAEASPVFRLAADERRAA